MPTRRSARRLRIALFGTIRRRQVPAPSAVGPAHGNRENRRPGLALSQRVGHAPEGAEVAAERAPGRLVERQEPEQLRNDQLRPAAGPRSLQRGFDQPSSVGHESLASRDGRVWRAEASAGVRGDRAPAPETARWPRPWPPLPRPGTTPPARPVAGRRAAAPRAPPSWDTTATPGRRSPRGPPRRARPRRQAGETARRPSCSPSR